MKIIKLILPFFIGPYLLGQQVPTGTSGNSDDWKRGGNLSAPPGLGGSSNIFGTIWNSPIYTRTNSANRMKLNGSLTYTVNGYNGLRDGYLLLGYGTTYSNSIFAGANTGAYSQLHLNGLDGSFVQDGCYRPWMKTGVTFTDNNDLSYMGIRKVGTGMDVTETVLAWSDNSGNTTPGPDDLVFRFTSGGGVTTINSNLRLDTDLDGLHVARFSGNGLFGLGNTFGTNPLGTPVGLYESPKSLMHMSYNRLDGLINERYAFLQITYRDLLKPVMPGIGENESDGLRFGIDNDIITGEVGNLSTEHLNGYLRWQENSSFVIQTEDNSIPNIQSNERMRITSLGALGENYGANYIGLDAPTQVSRISISHLGNNPLTRPMSLMHLGYNIGGVFGALEFKNGWRPWMDLGMLVSNSTDNVWIGLKPRAGAVSATNNQMDAVISWGNDGNSLGNQGPDVMRFIFTAEPLSNLDSSVAVTDNGLEIMRMYPKKDRVFSYSGTSESLYGRVGIGDFTITGVDEQPTHKLDVIGNGRFRYLPDSLYLADSLVNKYVMVDSMGVLRWTSAGPSFGAQCSDSVNGKLQFDTKVDLNNYNLYFTKNDSLGVNHVSVGYECGDVLPAKLSVYQAHPSSVNQSTVGVSGINVDTANVISLTFIGVEGKAVGEQPQFLRSRNIGGNFYAASADLNYGVYGVARPDSMPNSINTGGQFDAGFGLFSFGVVAQGGNALVRNVGVNGIGTSPSTPSSLENIGGQFVGAFSNGTNYGVRGVANFGSTAIGIYGTSSGATTNNWAGYFDGNVYISGTFGPSDQLLKENVENLTSADSLLNLLNPVTFDFKTNDFPQFHLSEESQMGLIAQDVETIIPTIVNTNNSPAQYDSIGAEIYPSVEFKSIDYTKLIPLLIAGHKEQATIIDSMSTANDSLQSQITNLNNRLTQLENCLSGILPFLCQMSNSAIQPTQEEVQNQLRTAINVNLSDRNAIVLNQNVPNPFAESTVITFTIPASVQKAQIHFYDGQGKLINLVDVIERGNGQLNVFANDLSTGVYTYSLVADGQIVATKRMMKQ